MPSKTLLVAVNVTVGITIATAAPLQVGSAQDPATGNTTIPLTYENGRITSQFLPYSKPFSISGSLTTSRGVADVVMAEEWEGDKLDAGVPWDASCWIRPEATPPATTFKLSFYKVLKLERHYSFRFTFGQTFPAPVLREAKRNALTELGDSIRLRGQALSNAEAGKALGRSIDQQLERISGTGAKWIHVVREGVCELVSDPPPIPVPDSIRDVLAQAAATHEDLHTAQQRLGTALQALQSFPSDTVSRLDSALRALHEHRAAAVPAADPGFTPDDVANLQEAYAAADASSLPPEGWNRLNALTKTPPSTSPSGGVLSASNRRDLTVLLNAIQRVRDRAAEVQEREQTATAAAGALDNLVLPTAGIYIPISEASETRTSWGTEADVRKLQIGTVVGAGSAFLNTGGSSDADGIMYLSLRFYLDAVDRSLPEPWASARSRWAIDIGALFKSTLHYHGQAQEEAFGGLTPTVGLSYDVSRYIALNAGFTIFRQPSVNPANGGKDKPIRSAPYIGVGFDFDAFNQLRELLSK